MKLNTFNENIDFLTYEQCQRIDGTLFLIDDCLLKRISLLNQVALAVIAIQSIDRTEICRRKRKQNVSIESMTSVG